MILITDRPNEARHLHKALSHIQDCLVLPLHQVAATPPTFSVIVCDVDLATPSAVELFRVAIARHRLVPKSFMFCVTRDDANYAAMRGYATDSIIVLPHLTSQTILVETIKQAVRARAALAVPKSPTDIAQAYAGEAALVLAEMFDAARRGQKIPVSNLESGGVAVVAGVGQASLRTWLDVVWKYDDTTYQHCLLVAGLTAAFALKLGLSIGKQNFLSQAALLHDIGKSRIPLEILNKPGKLSAPEMTTMQTHPMIGYSMLRDQKGLDGQLLEIVRSHHEYLDGSGYPDGLHGDQISNFIRIVTICDIYGALLERRAYKPPMPSHQALNCLVDMGSRLDGALVSAFHGMIAPAPR